MHLEESSELLKPYSVRISKDIVYGTGEIRTSQNGDPRHRSLKLDIYQPIVSDTTPLPSVILAFGGAFHRGSKEHDAFGSPPNRNNSISWYCYELARQGYIACSVDYRLVIENPTPGDTPVVSKPCNIPRSRVDTVREMMGLPKISTDMLWRGVEAASDDMALAVRYIKTHAVRWGVDPEKIAIGGFSAGARTALNVALGEKEPVAAVIVLSGYMHIEDLKQHANSATHIPSFLFIHAENDLDYVLQNSSATIEHLRQLGAHCESVEVPGATHFYPAQAPANHGSDGPTTVEKAIANFLSSTFRNLSKKGK